MHRARTLGNGPHICRLLLCGEMGVARYLQLLRRKRHMSPEMIVRVRVLHGPPVAPEGTPEAIHSKTKMPRRV